MRFEPAVSGICRTQKHAAGAQKQQFQVHSSVVEIG